MVYFITGLFIGTWLGVFLMCVLFASRGTDEEHSVYEEGGDNLNH